MSLPMWAVFDKPTDYPDRYVAREFRVVDASPFPIVLAGLSMVASPDLEIVRQHMLEFGLTCIGRNEGDDPKIVEVWL